MQNIVEGFLLYAQGNSLDLQVSVAVVLSYG